jgi:SAM-dependent methyltransferase
MQRRVIAELLDDDLGTPEEIASSLTDLRHINSWFGGLRTATSLLRKVAAQTGVNHVSLLEIGSGVGDVPLSAQRTLSSDGVTVTVTLLDRQWRHLPASGGTSVCGDAMRLPFRDGAFDVVSCTLFAHHFDPQPLHLVIAEALRVSRRAVLVNDLIRSPLHLLLVYLGLPLFRSRLTWHDAPASVKAAYTIPEMKLILSALPSRQLSITRHLLFRMGVLLWK